LVWIYIKFNISLIVIDINFIVYIVYIVYIIINIAIIISNYFIFVFI